MAKNINEQKQQNSKLNHITGTVGSVWSRTKETVNSLHETTSKHANYVNEQYQNSKARECVESALQKSGQGLDTISGKAMYELVRQRLDIQDKYNDLLATKLQESLDRIEKLESQLDNRTGIQTNEKHR